MRDREVLTEDQDALQEGREVFPEGREESGGNLGEVGDVERPSKRSGKGRDALPEVGEGFGGTPKVPGRVRKRP